MKAQTPVPRPVARFVTFDSSTDTPSRSFERWCDQSFPGTASIMRPVGDPHRFFTTRDQAIFKRFSITRANICGLRFSRRAEQARRDGQDFVWVELAVSGRAPWHRTQRGVIRPGAGSVLINDASRWSQRATNDNAYVGLNLSRDLVSETGLPGLHGATLPPSRARMVGRYMQWLAARAPQVTDEDHAEHMTVAVLGFAATGMGDYAQAAAPALSAITFAIVRDHIDAHMPRREVEVDELVRASGVSRSTLYRLFKPIGGLGQFIERRRATMAWDALTDTADARSLGQIGDDLGYSSQSNFTRSFRRAFDLRPSDFRR